MLRASQERVVEKAPFSDGLKAKFRESFYEVR
jgi:hypothetical protein